MFLFGILRCGRFVIGVVRSAYVVALRFINSTISNYYIFASYLHFADYILRYF